MLIRPAVQGDKASWIELAKNVAHIFGSESMPYDKEFHEYIDIKISKHEAVIALDRRTQEAMGIIGFSRGNNRISWLGVLEKHRGKGIGSKLLECAINQLDSTKEITVITFQKDSELGIPARRVYEKFGFEDVDTSILDPLGNPRAKMARKPTGEAQGHSFHYKYDDYAKMAKEEGCPVCQGIKHPDPPILIKELEHSWLECYMEAQGALFGKCHLLSKVHSEHFYDMNQRDMMNFIGDLQKAAKALHKVTGAVKINYELHGNTIPHLHAHLFPRYLDDRFPSAPIDYRVSEPSPYEDEEEFNWFLEQMRYELNVIS